MDNSKNIFNKNRQENFRRRQQKNFSNHSFLYDWTAKEIATRLNDITREFKSVFLTGPSIFKYLGEKFPNAIISEKTSPESLVPHVEQFDCIISIGELHSSNDLPGLLIQLRRALKPDGVFIAAFAGGETLHELRHSLMQSEIKIFGGASPRIYPFIDMQQMSSLMQRAGFALPVVDSEIIPVSYKDIFHIMADIRGIGESNSLTDCHKTFSSSRLFFEASQFYQENYREISGRVKATYEIIFIIGWAPHASQQKPARRGSGQVSLTEIL